MPAPSKPHDPIACAHTHAVLRDMIRERDYKIAYLTRRRWWQVWRWWEGRKDA